jgi:hypothetical protein
VESIVRVSGKRKLVAVAVGFIVGSLIVAAAFGIPAYRAHLQRQHDWKVLYEQTSRVDAQVEKESKAGTPTPH